MRESASVIAVAFDPLISVNTFRSSRPGMYGHGAGAVTKKRGKRKLWSVTVPICGTAGGQNGRGIRFLPDP